MSGRASSGALDALHGLLAGALADELKRAAEAAAKPRTVSVWVEGKDGEAGKFVDQANPEYAPINPQLIDKVLKMLKDNGIDAPAKSPAMGNLAAALNDIDLDQFGARPN